MTNHNYQNIGTSSADVLSGKSTGTGSNQFSTIWSAPYVQPANLTITVQKVSNGWIVNKYGIQYVETEVSELLKYFQEPKVLTT